MKIICFVNAHSLAHVTRPLEIAKCLRTAGHEIIFAGFGQYLKIAMDVHFRTITAAYISTEQMNRAVKNNQLQDLFPIDQLSSYIDVETQIIQEEKPDLILVDCRVTAQTSAELCRRPCISITNSHMTNFRSIPFYSLQNQIPWIPSQIQHLTNRIENWVELSLYHHFVLGSLVKLRRQLNLPSQFCYANECGQHILIADIPEFNPVKPNKITHFIGPLPWHNTIAAPSWIRLLDQEKTTVYISLGSEGLLEILNHLDIFKDIDAQFIIATGQQMTPEIPFWPTNVFIEPFINTDIILPFCDLVICHGGNGTLYQALTHKLPVAGIASHAEQAYGLKRIEALKIGKNLKPDLLKNTHLFKTELVHLIDRLVNNSSVQKSIEAINLILKQWNGPQVGADLIEKWMENKK